MTAESQQLSPVFLDEVWTLMKFATKTKDMKKTALDHDFFTSMPEHFEWECSIVSSEDENSQECTNAMKDSELVTENKDGLIHDAADKLAEIGDNLCTKKEEEMKLIEDIKKYLLGVAVDIDDRLDKQLVMSRPPEGLFKTGLISIAYRTFQSKLQSFLGLNDGVDKIAIVTHVARGVASGFKDSNLSAVHLVSALAYKFVLEKYEHILKEHGSVTELAKLANRPKSTD